MHAPSAARNVEAILDVILKLAPKKGTALEIASGTGEHMVRFAQAMPDLVWQPTDVDDNRLASIQAWNTGLPNVLRPLLLDATRSGWSRDMIPVDLVYLSNLLHLISHEEAAVLVKEAGDALAPDGVLLIYGPFRRGQAFASEADRRFHADLTAQDPAIGYKSLETVQAWQSNAGLTGLTVTEMPANNLILAAWKNG